MANPSGRRCRSVDEIRECLTGPVASLNTPFSRDGSVDFGGLRAPRHER